MISKEFEFLKIINNTLNSPYLGNDCAYLDGYKLAITSDSLIEDVHFSLLYMNPYEIAQKALLVNISDILASGAIPKYALINLSGKLDSAFVEAFYKGLKLIAQEYDVQIIGGDLTKSEKIMVSITLLGSYKDRRPSSRFDAKAGYIVGVTGEFGSSAKGLEELKALKKESYFINCHKKPSLYPLISSQIALGAKHPYAMMDSSDSLFDCLYQISNKSKIRINVDYSLIPKKVEDKDMVLYGGEDYSLVVCLHKDDFVEGIKIIGSCEIGEGVYVDNKKTEYKGYKHFD